MLDLKNSKRFSIGLNMEVDLETYEKFLEKYSKMIGSIYFSLPLGRKFYSRTELENDFENEKAKKKLFDMLKLIKKFSINRELTINTYYLTEEDLNETYEYLIKNNIIPEEIVCLAEYGNFYKNKFPNAKIKYSFNNPSDKVPESFDTVVLGKKYLRDEALRKKYLEEGKEVVLLLNNGCSYTCHYKCGDAKFCGAILKENLKKYTLDELYALQSFFPFELKHLLEIDENASKYRFKISNRPLGLEFTKLALDCYSSFMDVTNLIKEDNINYGLFCTMYELWIKRDEFDFDKIMSYKYKLLNETLEGKNG